MFLTTISETRTAFNQIGHPQVEIKRFKLLNLGYNYIQWSAYLIQTVRSILCNSLEIEMVLNKEAT